MKTTRYFMAAAMAIALAACNNEMEMEDTAYVPDEGEIQLMMMHPHQTRVTETSFEASDSIGVYVTASDAALQLAGNEVNNDDKMETYPRLVNAVNRETGIAGTSRILSIMPRILPFSSRESSIDIDSFPI